MTNLPQEFLDKMKALLGEEYEDFLASYDCPRNFGLRVNVGRISPEEFQKLAPFHMQPVPWTENGFYYTLGEDETLLPARHPFYYAGLYYLQEPSAMTPAAMLKVNPGEKVLDLCAAPGGKATELGSRLHGKGLLVANDISATRAKALLKNIEVFGIPNAFVTNETPAHLAGQFPEFFDKILVDAPCSGEGMFRKDPAVAKAWNAEKPFACAKQQKEIITQAANMLAPGGQMLYSTCTFSPEENEQVIAYLLDSRDDMEVLKLPQVEGFSPGLTQMANAAKGEHFDRHNGNAQGISEIGDNHQEEEADRYAQISRCVRIWPHKMNGEGHFLALLQKKGNKVDIKEDVTDRSVGNKTINSPEMQEFFRDITMTINWKRVEIRKDQAYYVPEETRGCKGLTFLRNGLYLGEIRKGRFEPSQSLAMALKKEEYASVVDLEASDERVMKYLKGETLEVEDLQSTREKGWQLVCVSGYPLGWGKLVNGTLKNKYHIGWRAQ